MYIVQYTIYIDGLITTYACMLDIFNFHLFLLTEQQSLDVSITLVIHFSNVSLTSRMWNLCFTISDNPSSQNSVVAWNCLENTEI